MTSATTTATPAPAPSSQSEQIQMPARIAYAVATLSILWCCAGGNIDNFWSRLPALGLILLAVGLAVLGYQKRLPGLALQERATWMTGLASGVASALPFLVLILLVRQGVALPDFIRAGVSSLAHPSAIAVVSALLLVAPGFELVSRGVLQPAWGIGNVAFLDALTVGFGLQHLAPFLAIWIMGIVWGFVARRTGLGAALVSHVIWNLIVFGALASLPVHA